MLLVVRDALPTVMAEVPKCIGCDRQIGAAARICEKCGSYQHRWRNELKYWAGVGGLFTLIASGLLFTVTSTQKLYQLWFREDVVVSEYEPFNKLTLWNVSEWDIWVTQFRIRSDWPDLDLLWTIDRTLAPKSGTGDEPINFQTLTALSWKGTAANFYHQEPGDFAPLNPNQLDQMRTDPEFASTFVPTFLHPGSLNFKQVKERYRRNGADLMQTFSCTAEISYRRAVDGKDRQLQVPCIGTFRNRN